MRMCEVCSVPAVFHFLRDGCFPKLERAPFYRFRSLILLFCFKTITNEISRFEIKPKACPSMRNRRQSLFRTDTVQGHLAAKVPTTSSGLSSFFTGNAFYRNFRCGGTTSNSNNTFHQCLDTNCNMPTFHINFAV
jgi:hypothetical protein